MYIEFLASRNCFFSYPKIITLMVSLVRCFKVASLAELPDKFQLQKKLLNKTMFGTFINLYMIYVLSSDCGTYNLLVHLSNAYQIYFFRPKSIYCINIYYSSLINKSKFMTAELPPSMSLDLTYISEVKPFTPFKSHQKSHCMTQTGWGGPFLITGLVMNHACVQILAKDEP